MSAGFTLSAFDSGLGGLSALMPLLQNSQGGLVTYLGDFANLPYGSKSARRIDQLSTANIQYLIDEKHCPRPDLLIVACNTASSYAMESIGPLLREQKIPYLGVIEPSCREATRRKPKRILVLATQGTVASRSYENELRKLGYSGEVVPIACPLFVPFVEEGVTSGPALQWVIERYLAAHARAGDLAILGCTHYPFLLGALQTAFPDLQFVHAGEALRNEALVQQLIPQTPAGQVAGSHSLELLFTDTASRLEPFLKLLNLKEGNTVQVREIPPII